MTSKQLLAEIIKREGLYPDGVCPDEVDKKRCPIHKWCCIEFDKQLPLNYETNTWAEIKAAHARRVYAKRYGKGEFVELAL